jgi:hypothetical protein
LLRKFQLYIFKSSKDEATKIFQQIDSIIDTHLGHNHSNSVYIHNLLASFLESQGAHELALGSLASCSKVMEGVIGRDHTDRVDVGYP